MTGITMAKGAVVAGASPGMITLFSAGAVALALLASSEESP